MYSKDIKIKIMEDRRNGDSYRQISNKHNIARSSIQRIIQSYNRKLKKTGPKKKLSKHDVRRIKTVIDNETKISQKISSRKLITTLNLNVSRSTVCKELKCVNYEYSNLPSKFNVTSKMKMKRVEIVKSYIMENVQWDRVVFSDEKKFSLHGCDSFFTWINKNQSPSNIRRHLRSPSLMVWAMILPNGLLSYEIMRGNQNSDKYINIISKRALPIIKLALGNNFVFQQDNCPIHVSKQSKIFFRNAGINLLKWPPYSPDLNIIENVWSILSNLVFKDGPAKNLKNLEFLLSEAVQIFNEKKRGDVINLYASIRKRLCEVLVSKGNRIKY